MDRRGVSHQELERLVENQATVMKLRQKIAGARVEAYFESHASDFDTACVAEYVVGDDVSARDAVRRVQEGRTAFLEEAQRQFLVEHLARLRLKPTSRWLRLARSHLSQPRWRADGLDPET
jgi:hypothetical protein